MPDFIGRPPEVAPQETAPEQQREHGERPPQGETAPLARQDSQQPTARPQINVPAQPAAVETPADVVLKSVEEILSDGLMNLYATFPEDRKATFRETGEKTARKIRDMIMTGKTKVIDILRLIRTWLHTIPGVSRFFLEQEAKIKTDRILSYSDEYRASHV